MKRFYISLLAVIFAAIQVIAAPVDPEKALEIANDFWASKVSELSRLVPANRALKAPSLGGQSKEQQAFYVFTGTDNNGFVIVAGDDRLAPIVGYSTNAVSGEMPPALIAWLNEYSEYVNEIRTGKAKPKLHKARVAASHIEPMLLTAWDQIEPYNNLCPLLNNERTYTGCGNTAAAQVMRFHKWPASPIADVEWHNNITGKKEYCELKSHVYDWDNMIYDYNVEYSETEAKAVAQLMADLGKATQSVYEAEGTSCTVRDVAAAFVNVFNYSPELAVALRSDYTYDEYIAMIRENLDNRQPVIYSGYAQNYAGGHAFVCDGIDANNLLHIDWGWGGLFNGYFDIAMMDPEGSGIGGFDSRYNVGQVVMINIKPRAEGEVNKGGIPVLATLDPYDDETEENVDELTCEFLDGIAEVSFTSNLMNRSHSDAEGSVGVGVMDMNGNLVREIEFYEGEVLPTSNNELYYGGYSLEISNESDSEEYLPAGKYSLGLFFMNTYEEVEYLRGTDNGLILEVTDSAVTLSLAEPHFEFDKFNIVKMPEHSNEELVFNATFVNNGKLNATVILVPVINHYKDGEKVKCERLTGSAESFQILDVNNILITFEVPEAFAKSGTYTITFEYLTTNSYIGEDDGLPGNFDMSRLKSIKGESAPFEVEIIPDGDDEYDYSFSAEFIGQETFDGSTFAVIRAAMGKDVSECKFVISNETNENAHEAIAKCIALGEYDNDCYILNESKDVKIPLVDGEYALVFVLYDVNGEPLDKYYTVIFNLATGLENIKDNESGIHFDRSNKVVSVAKEGVIELLDASGRLLKRVNGNSVSTADLETGMYIVKYNKNIVKVFLR